MSSIGAKRERIRIERLTRTQRNDGGYSVTTETVVTLWASVDISGAQETEEAGRLTNTSVRYVFETHRVDGITTDHTLVWLTRGGMQLNIKEVHTPPIREMVLRIVAESGVTL